MSSRFSQFLPESISSARPDVDVADLVDESVVVFDLNQVVSAWNTEAEHLYGWRRDEVIGGKIQAAVRCAPSEALAVILAKVHEQGEWRGEFVRSTKSGATVVVKAKWSLRKDADGKPIDIVETSRDITEMKRARAAEERSERRYRNFFNFMPIALFHTESGPGVLEVFKQARAQGITDFSRHLLDHPELVSELMQGQQITEVNQRTVDVLRGRSVDDLIGPVARHWRERPETFREIMTARYSGKKSFEALTRLTTCDGAVIDVLFFAAFAPITGWEHVSLIALIDVSDRVKAQNMLAKLQADIAHAARVAVLGELTASIAHEVSQPLTAIEANTEASLLWLAHVEPNLAEVRELSARTAAEVQRAADILQRIRSMAVRASPVKAPVSMSPLIDEAVLFLGHELTRQGIEVKLELDRDLPALVGDRVQLQQVIINLAINAIQSMTVAPAGTRVLTFRTCAAHPHSQLVEVEDSGPGIEPEALDRLFEGFFTTKASGMGIGLAICRSIVEEHGGKIEARNRADSRGAVFTIELPLPPSG
jgi:PAS domain S-box-containing protein